MSRVRSFWSLFFAGFVATLMLVPSCTEAPAPVLTQPISSEEARVNAWADSVLATLNPAQKAAQLILVEANLSPDSLSQRVFADVLGRNGFGGVIVDQGQRDTLQDNVHAWKEACRVPLIVALDAGKTWSANQDWVSLLTLGTVASDSMARAWGEALGAESRFLGANVCLVSAGKVGEKGAWMSDALGVVPSTVTRLSDALMTGIQAIGVQPCMRPMLGEEDMRKEIIGPIPAIRDDIQALNMGKCAPLQALLQAKPHSWLQATDIAYAAVDSAPIGYSHRAIHYFLHTKLAFEGLVLSPRGADVRSLVAGADFLVAPRDPLAAVRQILSKVQVGEVPEDWLDTKARRVLRAKAQLRLDRTPPPGQFTIDPYRRLLQIDRALSKSTFVVLRDTKNRLPLGSNITQSKVATLAIGSPNKTDLQMALDAYANVEHYLLGTKNDSLGLAKQIERFKKYDYVVLSLHSSLVRDSLSGRLPSNLVRFLKKLDRSTRLVVVDLAGQASLQDLDSLSCLAFVSEDRGRNAQIAGQAIMGAFPVTTLLPDDISPAFTAGMGKVLKQKLRFEYTEPEDLGIDPHAIYRIDSFVENAIRRGVFPGCQVFAAKDGKVFLHKGYGYHDYEHSQRVRTTDLYDIASVSKIAATTLMAMAAFDYDTLKLLQPLKYFLPELDSAFISIKDITPQELLTHSSGLPAGVVLNKYFKMIHATDSIREHIYSKEPDSAHTLRIADQLYLAECYRDTVWDKVRRMRLGPKEYEYSDLSMYLMKAVLERILAAPLERYVDSMFYRPMGLRRIGYHPLDRFEKEEIVPTEVDRGWRKQLLRGDVHDPTVAFLGGVGGPAGIFSNSADLATVMQMVLNGGSYGGKQYFKPETVALFTARQLGHRGLGFDLQLSQPQCESGYCCYSADPRTFGHFGYTGTCAWADPQNGIVYVLLSNRVYPTDDNKKINAYRVRQGVQEMIYAALGLSYQ